MFTSPGGGVPGTGVEVGRAGNRAHITHRNAGYTELDKLSIRTLIFSLTHVLNLSEIKNIMSMLGFPWWFSSEESACQNLHVRSLGREDPLEKEMATHSSILSWRVPSADEPGKLQSMGSQESDTT